MSDRVHTYLLRPLDTLFFRGGQPFNAGDDHFVQSQFPPTPRTLQGIVRTRLLQQSCTDLGDESAIRLQVGDGDELPEDLEIRGPFLAANGEPWFPAPGCLLQDEDGNWHRMRPKEGLLNDLGLSLPANPSVLSPKPVDGWIAWPLMRWALWDYARPDVSAHWSGRIPLWEEHEVRTGIAREGISKTARQRHLYSAGHIRLKAEVALWFQSTRAVQPGVMPVGGEGRLAAFEKAKQVDLRLPDDVAQKICADGRFWLVLVQPARFNGGWKPEFSRWEDADMQGLGVELITAIVREPQRIGGFDLVKRRPNDMFAYVPAGSSYLLKLTDPLPDDAPSRLQRLHNQCVLGNPNERQMGFGHVMIGNVLEDPV